MFRTCAVVLMLFSVYAGELRPQSQTASTKPELDVRKIALKSKSVVEGILGQPLKSLGGGQYDYPWGFVVYRNGRLTDVDYTFRQRPRSVAEALARVGLQKTSEPVEGPFSYYWNSSTGPLVCCGFEFDNVVILKDLSDIAIGVRSRR